MTGTDGTVLYCSGPTGTDPSVTTPISSGQPEATITMVLAKGAAVPIRIEDPGQLVSQNLGKTTGADLLVGVPNDAMAFRSARVVSTDANGRNHEIVVPFNSPVKLVIYSSFFRLADEAGATLAGPGAQIPVLAQSGRAPVPITLRVTGRR